MIAFRQFGKDMSVFQKNPPVVGFIMRVRIEILNFGSAELLSTVKLCVNFPDDGSRDFPGNIGKYHGKNRGNCKEQKEPDRGQDNEKLRGRGNQKRQTVQHIVAGNVLPDEFQDPVFRADLHCEKKHAGHPQAGTELVKN